MVGGDLRSGEGNGNESKASRSDRLVRTQTFRPGPDAYISTGAEGTALVEVQKGHTTVVFAWWHNVVDGRNNLGPETFEGSAAYRYRLTRTRDERSVHDVANSDQLSLQLAQTRWKTYPEIEDEIHLTDIHLTDIHLTDIHLSEPPQALFDIPPALHVIVTRH
jgi:hypothetical protein